jgi:phosphate-selective porin OprO/OprP
VNQLETGDPLQGPIDRLVYRRLRIGVGGTVPPGNMSYRLEIEFSGEEGSQFRDAWIGWDDLAFLGTLRLGNQKRPYGLDQLNSSNFELFMERSFITEAVNEGNRRFGLAAYGASDNLAFNWRWGVYDIDLIQDLGSTLSDKYPLELAGRLASTWWFDEVSGGRGYGHVALSGTCAFPDPNPPRGGASDSRARFRTRPEGRSSRRWLDTGSINGCDAYQLLGVESVFNAGRFQVGGEFMNLWLQREAATGPDLYMHGGYLYLSWFLTGEHIPWNRELGILGRVEPFEDFFNLRTREGCLSRGTGAWEIATRFSYGDLTDRDLLGGVGQSVTFALNWYWNAHARLQWNYIFGRISDRAPVGQTSGAVSGSYQISGVRGIIDF